MQQPGQRIVRHFIALCTIAILARVWAEFTSVHIAQGDYGWFNLRAFASDMLISFVAALLFSITERKWVVFGLYFLWAGLCAGNLVHIEANSANINFNDSGQLGEQEFVLGSVLSMDVMMLWGVFLAVGMGLNWLLKKLSFKPQHTTNITIAVPLVMFCGVWFLPMSENYWRSYNIFEENASDYLISNIIPSHSVSPRLVHKEYKKYTDLDLRGEQFAGPVNTKPNILIVAIEGLSDFYLQRGQMPYLKELATKSIYYPNFISPQQYTLNGIFSILCGDYSSFGQNLVFHKRNKWFATLNHGALQPCIPQLLAKHGYKSLFFQGSSLDYTNKRKFVKTIGFDQAFSASQLRTKEAQDKMKFSFLGWGMADNVFLPSVADRLIRYSDYSKKPWFAFAMTTGTHHPYNITKEYSDQFPTRPFAAYRAADEGLQSMMARLEDANMLANTLVIVIGDESRLNLDRNFKFSPMAANWGLAVIKTPDNVAHTSREYFMQPDIKTSVLDYIGASHEATNFRSVFRKYDTFRPIMMASAHSRFWLTYFAKDKIMICRSNRTNCRTRKLEGELFDAKLSPAKAANEKLLTAVAMRSDDHIQNNSKLITEMNTIPVADGVVIYEKRRISKNKVIVRKKVYVTRRVAKKKKKPVNDELSVNVDSVQDKK